MRALDWLTARPVAHRGLHNAAAGIIENTPSAVQAAVDNRYGIEVDLQITADGEAMVHHDDALGRLTEGGARLADLTAAQCKAVRFFNTADRMLTLGELCDLVGGRSTLMLELKSRFDGDRRLVDRVAAVLARYDAPIATMSFDPFLITALRAAAPQIPRGIVAERRYDDPEWDAVPASEKRSMAYLLHAPSTRPHFVAYWVRELPSALPWVARHLFGRPLLTWTVRTPADRAAAQRYADQMIFEEFRP